jgi:hypothetical protein
MTEPEETSEKRDLPPPGPFVKRTKPRRLRFAGRLFLLLSLPLTCLYVWDVPRAFNYMLIGDLPPRLHCLWLEHSVRPLYLPGKFSRKLIRGALPAAAIASSAILFAFGCAASVTGHRANVSCLESFVWSSIGALLLGINAMTTWIIWKAFVFL